MENNSHIPLTGKHSCGDLHSRLKTRKLLGVGETDDGDVHRSKLSQILGHSDQLYIQLPGGLRAWQIVLASLFTIMSVWAFLFPSNYFMFMFETDGSNFTLPIRLYASAISSLSLIYWFTVQASDRETIRMVLLSSVVFFSLQILVLVTCWLPWMSSQPRVSVMCSLLAFSLRILTICISCWYYWLTNKDGSSRKEVKYYQ